MKTLKTDSSNPDFINLVKSLDVLLSDVDGDDHSFYDQFNQVDEIKHVIIAFHDDEPVACGAMKHFNDETMELKRMYTKETHRGKGFASAILKELESWMQEMDYQYAILETGIKLTGAVALYKKNDYQVIPNYGQYLGMEDSICFRKKLIII